FRSRGVAAIIRGSHERTDTGSVICCLLPCAAVLALLLSSLATYAEEPYRTLWPAGDAPHPAVLLVPGCSGFVVSNGVDHYNERAADLQAAGYVVVFVDYIR